jgi:hypothetical protein
MTVMGSTTGKLDGAPRVGARSEDDLTVLAFVPHATREHVSVVVGQADDGYYMTWLALRRTLLHPTREYTRLADALAGMLRRARS